MTTRLPPVRLKLRCPSCNGRRWAGLDEAVLNRLYRCLDCQALCVLDLERLLMHLAPDPRLELPGADDGKASPSAGYRFEEAGGQDNRLFCTMIHKSQPPEAAGAQGV